MHTKYQKYLQATSGILIMPNRICLEVHAFCHLQYRTTVE